MLIKDKQPETFEEFAESHSIHCNFKPEIELMLSITKIQLIECCKWIIQQEPGIETESVYCVAKG
jgi:hypothetical protein